MASRAGRGPEWTEHESCHDQQVRTKPKPEIPRPGRAQRVVRRGAARRPRRALRVRAARRAEAATSRSTAASRSSSSNRSTAGQNGTGNGGLVETIMGAATKVRAPAVAVGATAVGSPAGLCEVPLAPQEDPGIPVPRLSTSTSSPWPRASARRASSSARRRRASRRTSSAWGTRRSGSGRSWAEREGSSWQPRPDRDRRRRPTGTPP